MSGLAIAPTVPSARRQRLMRGWFLLGAILLALVLKISLLATYRALPIDDELVTESTLGRLSLWMAGQSGGEADDLQSSLGALSLPTGRRSWDKTNSTRLCCSGALANLRTLYLGIVALLLAYGAAY